MHHELLTQRALLKRGTLSQHFMTHVIPPLVWSSYKKRKTVLLVQVLLLLTTSGQCSHSCKLAPSSQSAVDCMLLK